MSAQELEELLDRGEGLKPVMTLGELAFQGQHIPGLINTHSPKDLTGQLNPPTDLSSIVPIPSALPV